MKAFLLFLAMLTLCYVNFFRPISDNKTPVLVRETKTLFEFSDITFKNFQIRPGFFILHFEEQLERDQLEGLVPTFSWTANCPETIVGYNIETSYKHNVDYVITQSIGRSTIAFFFYEYGEKGQASIYIQNDDLKMGYIKDLQINCVPPG